MYFLLYICPVKSDRKEQLCVYPFIFRYIIIVPRLFKRRGGKPAEADFLSKYISKYSDLAIQHQKKYRIPASITLAQGITGIRSWAKATWPDAPTITSVSNAIPDWRGGRGLSRRRPAGECFRKYKRVEDSYDDHSRFLAERSRYERLFKLNIKDYKGWAKGLQKCGYATDRAYANKLIKVIEDYELYRFDSGKRKKKTSTKKQNLPVFNYQVYRTHGLIYVYAKDNDSFDQIARSMGFKAKQLMKFNEVPEDFPLQAGDIVYLKEKRRKRTSRITTMWYKSESLCTVLRRCTESRSRVCIK